mmetsp:Transcript_53786/g.123753  ORF Transcript_53786/g.123753 Transcript_53786/m.123753 type:complete len:230 (-) Transcript_53786:473-1162(-)
MRAVLHPCQVAAPRAFSNSLTGRRSALPLNGSRHFLTPSPASFVRGRSFSSGRLWSSAASFFFGHAPSRSSKVRLGRSRTRRKRILNDAGSSGSQLQMSMTPTLRLASQQLTHSQPLVSQGPCARRRQFNASCSRSLCLTLPQANRRNDGPNKKGMSSTLYHSSDHKHQPHRCSHRSSRGRSHSHSRNRSREHRRSSLGWHSNGSRCRKEPPVMKELDRRVCARKPPRC